MEEKTIIKIEDPKWMYETNDLLNIRDKNHIEIILIKKEGNWMVRDIWNNAPGKTMQLYRVNQTTKLNAQEAEEVFEQLKEHPLFRLFFLLC